MSPKPGLKTQVAVLEMGKKTLSIEGGLKLQLQGFGLAVFQLGYWGDGPHSLQA